MGKIRLGFVRADTHAYYYGIMLAKCDPMVLMNNNYVVLHYAHNIYDPTKMTMPRVDGFEIVKIYDNDAEAARKYSETFLGKPVVCEKLEDMADGVDAVFIANCDFGGGDHLELARPFLTKGIPTFVDKPFAAKFSDALEIVRLAEKHDTLLFNGSILTHVPAAERFRSRFAEISSTFYPVPDEAPEGVKLGVIKGVGGAFSQELAGKAVSGGIEDRMAYLIHGVALALNLFGRPVEWVEAMGELPLEYLHLHLKAGVDVMIMNTSTEVFPESCSFYASAYSKFGAIHSGPIGDPEFLGGGAKILQLLRQMMETGKIPTPYRDILEHNAVIEAAQLAQDRGKRVYLKEIWKE